MNGFSIYLPAITDIIADASEYNKAIAGIYASEALVTVPRFFIATQASTKPKNDTLKIVNDNLFLIELLVKNQFPGVNELLYIKCRKPILIPINPTHQKNSP